MTLLRKSAIFPYTVSGNYYVQHTPFSIQAPSFVDTNFSFGSLDPFLQFPCPFNGELLMTEVVLDLTTTNLLSIPCSLLSFQTLCTGPRCSLSFASWKRNKSTVHLFLFFSLPKTRVIWIEIHWYFVDTAITAIKSHCDSRTLFEIFKFSNFKFPIRVRSLLRYSPLLGSKSFPK